MSAAAVSSTRAAPRAKAVRKPAPEHPTYAVMVADAIEHLKERSGSSKTAILKYMTQHYKLGDNVTMKAKIAAKDVEPKAKPVELLEPKPKRKRTAKAIKKPAAAKA
ncbi:unnamed protein product [Strongylus vulgaris]|uniref:H15 domain-containing protein n=1 Tax=Strongylus vulgaris TaxID=40348 RepID=A0A3P7L9I6_STRVU|nr:unnamed protein product [Strongylus vulgaris]